MARFQFNPITRQFNVVKDAVDLGTAFKGPYENGITYHLGECVFRSGIIYVCLADTMGNVPPNPLYWEPLNLQGPVGPQGDPGAMGAAGGSSNLFVAGAVMGGHRVVTLDAHSQAIYADNSDVTHADRVVGLTLASTLAGAEVTVQSFGPVTEPSWQWDRAKSRLFLSNAGQMTQLLPVSGFVCVIGYVISETQIFVTIQPSIHRA